MTSSIYAEQLINFGIGMPNPELLPADSLRIAAAEGISADFLNYTAGQGNVAFRETLAHFLTAQYNLEISPDSLYISGGSLQAIHHICSRFTQPGDLVIVEEPTFNLMMALFRDHGLEIISIPVDDDGLDLDQLRAILRERQPKLVYTIPAFHNPTSVNMSAARKEALVQLSQEHDFFIIADEVYQLLSYTAEASRSFARFAGSERVFAVGSFSKILAPGLRLGWLITGPSLLTELATKGLTSFSGGFNHFATGIVNELIVSGQQAVILETIRRAFSARVAAMSQLLQAEMPDGVSFREPAGGYFFWLQLPDHIDSEALLDVAQTHQVTFKPGNAFSNQGIQSNFIRLSFGYFDEAAIEIGVKRLAQAIDTFNGGGSASPLAS